MDELTDLERSILDIERGWWRVAPTREQAIRNELGMSPSKYYLMLSRMLDSDRVWRADPVLVDRLRRLRDARLAERGTLDDDGADGADSRDQFHTSDTQFSEKSL